MARSEFVSAAGKVFEFVKGIAQEVQDMGGGDEDLGRVLSERQLRRQIAELIMSDGGKRDENVFPVSMNYDLSVEVLIRVGEYNWSNSDITEKNFRSEENGTQSVELRLVHFNRVISSEDALKELDRMGLRPATLKELLTFGSTYKEEQRKHPIVALGSVSRDWRGRWFVADLLEVAGDRHLNLDGLESDWRERCRFAAVRK